MRRTQYTVFGVFYIVCWMYLVIARSCDIHAILPSSFPRKSDCNAVSSPPIISSALPLIAASHKNNVRPPKPPTGIFLETRAKIEAARSGGTLSVTMPQLVTRGTKIVRKDNGQAVILKGVISDAFRAAPYVPDADTLIAAGEKIRLLGVNMIGFYLQPEPVYAHLPTLDLFTSWAAKNGVYVYFMPVLNAEVAGKGSAMDTAYDELMSFLAKRYSNQTHIMYGIGAEPYITAPELWLERTVQIGNGIRQHNPEAPILITGAKLGRNFEHVTLSGFSLTNTILFVEYYPRESPASTTLIPPTIAEAIPQNTGMPYIFGEFGGVWKSGFGSDEDINTIQDVIDITNRQDAAGYSLYRLEPYSEAHDGIPELSIQTMSGSLTRRGQILANDLYEFPPTFLGSRQ